MISEPGRTVQFFQQDGIRIRTAQNMAYRYRFCGTQISFQFFLLPHDAPVNHPESGQKCVRFIQNRFPYPVNHRCALIFLIRRKQNAGFNITMP